MSNSGKNVYEENKQLKEQNKALREMFYDKEKELAMSFAAAAIIGLAANGKDIKEIPEASYIISTSLAKKFLGVNND